jgi:hypothetical protein
MKLMVDTSTQRVVYAVAGKEVVDFLFDLLTLPIATVVKLLAGRDSMSMVGCIGDLRRSVELLDDQYICHADARAAKNALLCPSGDKLLRLPDAPRAPSSNMIGRRSTYSTGYVQGIVTYTITDSLQVTPMSTNSVINRFNTEHFSTLHGKIVLLGYSEVIIHVIS